MSYTGIQEAYTLLLYSLMATNILNFVSGEHLALVTISNHIKHPVLMPKCRLYRQRDIINAPEVFYSAFICCRTANWEKCQTWEINSYGFNL